MTDKENLYKLDLHEGFTTIFGIFIMRVPGGWIYDCWDFTKDCYKSGTFIPFDNGFQPVAPYDASLDIRGF